MKGKLAECRLCAVGTFWKTRKTEVFDTKESNVNRMCLTHSYKLEETVNTIISNPFTADSIQFVQFNLIKIALRHFFKISKN